MSSFTLGNTTIGPSHPPYFIAEISANHGGDFERAKRIIDLSAQAGAHAVKFQLYTADSLTLPSERPEFRISGTSLWAGQRFYDLYTQAATPKAWFPPLFAYAREKGLVPFASIFDQDGIDTLEALGVPAYKIASFEAVDLGLIQACAKTRKPLILSTGLCSLEEIQDAVTAFRAAGGTHLCLLRCNSAYPADPAEANLASIPDMANRFGVPVGYSDHTLDSVQSIAAVALGACVIEKHIIDSREPATADSAFSSLPDQFAELVQGCRAAYAAKGVVSYGPTERERQSLGFRRSLFVVRPVSAGETFSPQNIRSIRPANGLPPRALPDVLGKKATRDIEAGEPLTWDMIV